MTGIQVWAYEMLGNKTQPYQLVPGYPELVSKIHNSFPTAIDGCYTNQKTNKVLFLMRWMYFSVPFQALLVLIVLIIFQLF